MMVAVMVSALLISLAANAQTAPSAHCAAPVSNAAPTAKAETAHRQASSCYERAVALENAGRYDQAILDLTLAIKLDPDFVDAFASRGVAYDQKGFYDRAIADYTHAIAAADPATAPAKLAETYFNRGAAYEHRRLYRQAADDYRASSQLDPSLQPPQDGLKRLDGSR